MKYYETLFIIHPAIESNRLRDIIIGIQANLEHKGASIITTEVWGRRRLGYLIDKQKYGVYVLLQYSGDGINISEFNVDMEHDANILAYMTVKIKKDGIREQKADLDTQIAGTIKDEVVRQLHKSDRSEIRKEPAREPIHENEESEFTETGIIETDSEDNQKENNKKE